MAIKYLLRKAMKLLRGLRGLSRVRLREAEDLGAGFAGATEPRFISNAFFPEEIPSGIVYSNGVWLSGSSCLVDWPFSWALVFCRYSTNSSNWRGGMVNRKELKARWSGLSPVEDIRVVITIQSRKYALRVKDEERMSVGEEEILKVSKNWRERFERWEKRWKREGEGELFSFSFQCRSSRDKAKLVRAAVQTKKSRILQSSLRIPDGSFTYGQPPETSRSKCWSSAYFGISL